MNFDVFFTSPRRTIRCKIRQIGTKPKNDNSNDNNNDDIQEASVQRSCSETLRNTFGLIYIKSGLKTSSCFIYELLEFLNSINIRCKLPFSFKNEAGLQLSFYMWDKQYLTSNNIPSLRITLFERNLVFCKKESLDKIKIWKTVPNTMDFVTWFGILKFMK